MTTEKLLYHRLSFMGVIYRMKSIKICVIVLIIGILFMNGCIKQKRVTVVLKEKGILNVGIIKVSEIEEKEKKSNWVLHDVDVDFIEYIDFSITEINGKIAIVDDFSNSNHGDIVCSLIENIYPGIEIYRYDMKGLFDLDHLANVINSIDDDVNVVSMSWGGDYEDVGIIYDNPLYFELKEKSDKGVILVASSGNDSDLLPDYPARYDFVYAIGSCNRNKLSDFSNRGADLYAQGEFGDVSGTSLSAPLVAGYLTCFSWSDIYKSSINYGFDKFVGYDNDYNFNWRVLIEYKGYKNEMIGYDGYTFDVPVGAKIYVWKDRNNNNKIDESDLYGYSGFSGSPGNFNEDGGIELYGDCEIGVYNLR